MSTYDELDQLTDEEVHRRIQIAVQASSPNNAFVVALEVRPLGGGEAAWDKTSKAAHPDLKAALYRIEVGAQREQLIQLLQGVEQRVRAVEAGFAELRGWLEADRQLDGSEIGSTVTTNFSRPTDWEHVILRLEGLLTTTKAPVIAAALALQGAYRAGWVARAALRWQERLGVAEPSQVVPPNKLSQLIDALQTKPQPKPRASTTWAAYENKPLTAALATRAFQTAVQPLAASLRAVAARLVEAAQDIDDGASGKPYVHALRGLSKAEPLLAGTIAILKTAWLTAQRAGREAQEAKAK